MEASGAEVGETGLGRTDGERMEGPILATRMGQRAGPAPPRLSQAAEPHSSPSGGPTAA